MEKDATLLAVGGGSVAAMTLVSAKYVASTEKRCSPVDGHDCVRPASIVGHNVSQGALSIGSHIDRHEDFSLIVAILEHSVRWYICPHAPDIVGWCLELVASDIGTERVQCLDRGPA